MSRWWPNKQQAMVTWQDWMAPGGCAHAGELQDQLESFETKRFVQRLLGKGDVNGLMGKIQDVIPNDKQPELLDTINKVRLGCECACPSSSGRCVTHTITTQVTQNSRRHKQALAQLIRVAHNSHVHEQALAQLMRVTQNTHVDKQALA